MMRPHLALPALTLLCAASAIPPTRSPAAEKRQGHPNIIWIMADDLGYGDPGCYGQKQIRTPNIDRLASQGLRFTQFYAGATVCAPSRCTLMTGLHNGHSYIRGNAKVNLRPEDVTVAEVLKSAGYQTALVGKWGLGHEGSTGVPTKQGFDYFFGFLDQTHAHNSYPTFLMRNEERVPLRNVVPNEGPVGQGVAAERVDFAPDLMADEAVRFIDRSKDAPFFLYFSPTLPHANNEAGKNGLEVPDPGEYANRDWPENAKRYAAMVTRLDGYVGRVLDRLKQYGLEKNTVLFFTSDNGPHREGGNDPDFFDSNGPLRGIKRDMYEGGIRVPMIVRWPGKTPAGKVSGFAGFFGDFMATAAEIAGVPAPPTDGISFLRAIRGRRSRQKRHKFLYWEFYEQGGKQGIRMRDWKAVAMPMGAPVELYNLKEDPGETHNVAADHPDVAAKLRKLMDENHVPSPLWQAIRRTKGERGKGKGTPGDESFRPPASHSRVSSESRMGGALRRVYPLR